MRMSYLKTILNKAVQGATVLLLGVSFASAQQIINLSAGPTTATMPDGSVVPMWGYTCGAPAGDPQGVAGVTYGFCALLNGGYNGWGPVGIAVAAGTPGGLQINLTNNLSFTGTKVPTSIVIEGLVGGGLGLAPTTTASPPHSGLVSNTVTWATPGTSPSFVPPPQGPRVQSFATEVAGGTTVSLTWANLKPGTYLLESGTHPSIQAPMGLIGLLVVTTSAPSTTTAPATEITPGCAYYNPGFNPTPSTILSTAGCAVPYDAEFPVLLSEIDPVQNNLVNTAVNTPGFLETNVWSGQPGMCGNPSAPVGVINTCYPPAVNYTPLYYLTDGVAFSRSMASNSLGPSIPAVISPTAGTTGSVLVRLVNAGLRMHVPAIVGSQVAGQTGGSNPIVTGFKVVAEDGNLLPGLPKIKSELFMAAGKTYDVIINGKATSSTGTIAPYPNALPIFDRELSLSGNKTERDAGMLIYLGINQAALPLTSGVGPLATPVARADTYSALVAGQALTVSDPSKGVIANDTNVYGVTLLTAPANGTVVLNDNGTFTYTPTSGTSDSFTYCANGTVTGGVCSSGLTALVTLGASNITDSGITCTAQTFNANIATYLAIKTPGVLSTCKDGAGLPLTVVPATVTPTSGTVTGSIILDANGGFTATVTSVAGGSYTFPVTVKNSHGTTFATTATAVFPKGSGLTLNVLDGQDKTTVITDYRWVIEEDRTFYVDPHCSQNPPPTGCPTATAGIVPTLGTNFHTSYMPYIAQGCTGPVSCEGGQSAINPTTGVHGKVVCDVGNGQCRTDSTGNGMTQVMPASVALDPTKRYYISILPGDAANPFFYNGGNTTGSCQNGAANSGGAVCGHGMGGASVPTLSCTPTPPATSCTALTAYPTVTVLTQPSPYPPGKLSVFVFEDDFPLNGEADGGGGIDVLSPNEPGLGGFQLHLWDAMGGNGDFTGQMTYDMFNQPLTNSLAGTKDPNNGNDACPLTANPLNDGNGNPDPSATGITGMIVTCPKYESDGVTLSPLAGQAVVANLMPGRWGVIATPGADRIARGEEWLQTNTLDGQKAHDVFTRIGEPSYFQEFGPASYHVSVGFANPAIINARKPYICNGTDPNSPQPGVGYTCNNTITGKVTGQRLSRTPDERLYSSGSHDTYYWSQCYVSFGDPDGEDFAFTKCNNDGTFTLAGLPDGDWRVTVFDQWNDALVDGLSTPVAISKGGGTLAMGDISTTQWQANLYTRTFIDDTKDGISQSDESGIPFANVAVRLRDGSLENLLVTDFTGTANFNETFPLFSWYTVETDVTRYKNTGTHVVYDVGGPADGSAACGTTGYPPCGNSTIGHLLASTAEIVSVPTNLRVPGSVYCANADCTGKSIQLGSGTSDPPSVCTTSTANPPITSCSTQLSSGRIDNPWTGGVEGWQGFPGQNNFIEFGKEPYIAGENGGIKGHVVYASTRPFDDPQMLVQTQWEPLVPHVTINLYQEGFASDGITPTLTKVDTTQTSSWDDYAQGFRADGVTPNMNCPGQGASSGAIPDLFFFSLYNQPNYLNFYNSQHGGPGYTPLPNNSQFKCYDGMHNWNQIQPVPYDGMYKFPSVTAVDANGKPTLAGTNCTICTADPVPAPDLYAGTPMLPKGKYVVEVVLPQGFELVKEEDKNILIGDNYIAPVTQEFGGLGNIFIIPDQASVAASQQYPGAGYNANNPQNPTQNLGTSPVTDIVPGFIPEPVWPCVGEARVVPDYISLYPLSKQVAPFAGATRNLCDRKEVTLQDQMGAIAKFYVYTSTHIASKFTGGITDDYTSEFDPFSPQFGEKFAPPNLPVSLKDWAGNEISRVYADHWGAYDGMTYSTWEVNPPNPTGYSPTMMVLCMNDPGPIPGPGGTMVTDPAYTFGYSQFCYELPFMPGTTQYLDTPVVPTSAFAGAGYNNVDCSYPAATPAVAEVDGDQIGPWVSAAGTTHTLTITALGDQIVSNYAYSGPSANTAPYNQKTITRHYGFGTRCTTAVPGSPTCNTVSAVTIGTKPATINSWGDGSITVQVPTGVANCAVQQQTQYGGSTAQCGELVITAGNGKQSIDAVTVTIGGKAPTHVAASGSIQTAIDAAAPGDLIIVDPTCTTASLAVGCTTAALHAGTPTQTASQATHNELLLMWKPVRLQGVGAASSIINANTHPAGKLDVWREHVNCLFGLSLQGTPLSTGNPYDPSGAVACGSTNGVAWNYFSPGYAASGTIQNSQVDPLPGEPVIGWDASLNGNLAQLLQEPSLMGALEGAGITVLAKGANFTAPVAPGAAGAFPTGTTLLTGPVSTTGVYANGTGDTNSLCHTSSSTTTNPFPSNFMCNPSSIDGLGITDSSQGGGAVFVHGWAHNLQIANNRIYSNAGTLSGGINMGQGEFAPEYFQGTTPADPGSCVTSTFGIAAGVQLPYCENLNVNIHNNNVSLNSSTGDELFSATPAGAGGISICTGTDFYKFDYNWVCGNLSSGDGGGVGHLGFSYNGDISHNSILFNQSLNPTVPANGGGLLIMGTPDIAPACGGTTDQDCVSAPNTLLPSDGVGPGLVVNANLIMGNAAESGSGGGLRLQNVNGNEVLAFPTTPSQWYAPTITNNIIADNVAGWDGAGISLLDALNTNIINNTVVSNSTTASAGILFTTIGAPLASSQGTNCVIGTETSCPQVSGLVSIQNSSVLTANLPTSVTCPASHFQPGTSASTTGSGANAVQPTCAKVSYPLMQNNIFWQNSAYYIGVAALSAQFQQNVVSLYNAFTTTLAPTQPQTDATAANGAGVTITGGTGACVAANYWDIGVRGDLGPTTHDSGVTLNPYYSVLTSTTGYTTNSTTQGHNTASNPNFASQYCDGSRTPPEFGASGWAVPAGISDATVPNPIFNLQPVATVDEGNNWINMRWGPLSLLNPVTNTQLGNYAPTPGSTIIDFIPITSVGTRVAESNTSLVPRTDFFGNARPETGTTDGQIDPGAVEVQPPAVAIVTVSPTTLTFNTVIPTASAAQTLTLSNAGGATFTGPTLAFTQPAAGLGTFSRPTGTAGGTCAATLAAGTSCTINVIYTPGATATTGATGSLAITGSVTVTGSPVSLTGNSVAATHTATVTPSSLAFGNWATGTTSNPLTLTVRNTGNSALAGGTFTFGGGTPQPYSRPTGTAGGTCTAALAVGASCTVTVRFAPTTVATFSRTLTVSYTGATVTGSPVALSGAGVAAKATVSIAPNPLTITLPSGTLSGTGVVTLTNTAAAGSSSVAVTNVAVSGSGLIWAWTKAADNCTGVNLAPGSSCTVGATFTRLLSVGTHTGAIAFTDTGSTNPTGVLTGIAQ